MIQAGDVLGGCLELAGGAGRLAGDELHVERGFAAVAGDLEHVVLGRIDGPAADLLGARAELLHVAGQLGAGRDQLRDRRALPVGALRKLGNRQVEVFGGLDVGEPVPGAAQHLGDVLKAREAGVHPVVAAAGGVDLDLGDGLPERRCPAVEVLDAGAREQVGPQVAAHHVRLGDAVGDRGRGRERRDPGAVARAEVLELHVQVRGAL